MLHKRHQKVIFVLELLLEKSKCEKEEELGKIIFPISRKKNQKLILANSISSIHSMNLIFSIVRFSIFFQFFFFFFQGENFIEEEPAIIDEEICYGKRCTANEHCCPGSVCVDVDGGKASFDRKI
jgi:hypothetical protein